MSETRPATVEISTSDDSISSLIARQSEVIPQALNTMMISGSLWRVAAHAKNIHLLKPFCPINSAVMSVPGM